MMPTFFMLKNGQKVSESLQNDIIVVGIATTKSILALHAFTSPYMLSHLSTHILSMMMN